MMKNPHMNKVFDIYYSSFKRLITFGPVNNHEDNERFVVLLNDLVGGSKQLKNISVLLNLIFFSFE